MKIVRLGWILSMCMLLCLSFSTGCASWNGNVPNLESGKPNMNLQTTVNATTLLRYKIAWLPSVGIVAASLAVVAIFLGATKVGVAVLGASLFGVWMSVTLSAYAHILALAGLVAAIALAVAMVVKMRKTNVSLVKGIQSIKSKGLLGKDRVNEIVSAMQDSDITREVKRIKRQIAVKAAYLKEKS